MGELAMIVITVAGLSAFAWTAARFVGLDSTSLWPLGASGRDTFWQRMLPWPRGVQEDDEIAWHVPTPSAGSGAGSSSTPIGPIPMAGRPIPPTRPQRRIAGR